MADLIWRLPSSKLLAASPSELLFHRFYQGALMGAVPLFSLSRAIDTLGTTRATAFISLAPVLGAAIMSEVPSSTEDAGIVAIRLGVLLATGIVSLRFPGIVWRVSDIRFRCGQLARRAPAGADSRRRLEVEGWHRSF